MFWGDKFPYEVHNLVKRKNYVSVGSNFGGIESGLLDHTQIYTYVAKMSFDEVLDLTAIYSCSMNGSGLFILKLR